MVGLDLSFRRLLLDTQTRISVDRVQVEDPVLGAGGRCFSQTPWVLLLTLSRIPHQAPIKSLTLLSFPKQ